MYVVAPASKNTWEQEIPELVAVSKGEFEVFQSALYMVTAYMRSNNNPNWKGLPFKQRPALTLAQKHRLYGKILWNYLGDDPPPSKDEKKVAYELSRLYFAYYLKKILDSNPVLVSR